MAGTSTQLAVGPVGKLIDTHFAKWLMIINGLVPAALLVWDAEHHHLGVNEVNFAIHTTGLVGLVCLMLSLAITPVRKLTGWNGLIAVRRNLGVLGFFYISLHFAIFFWWDREGSITSTVDEIISREYLWYGFGALVAMVPLVITSTDGWVTRLGAKRWKLLHKLAYPIAIAGVIHYYELVKSDTTRPKAFAYALAVLLSYRVVMHYVDVRKELAATHAKLLAAKNASPKKKKFWQGELKIARIFDETPDVKTIRFVAPDGGPLPFEHIAGQYINLQLTIDGKRVNRSYTMSSSPTRNAYVEISVKKAANGYGSKHVHETFKAGQLVKVAAPSGKFYFAGSEASRVVLVAGGIGITPMMSVVRSLTDRGWAGDMYLLFSVRTQQDIVFREELDYLQKRYANLHVCVTLSKETDPAWTGARGNVNKELVRGFVPDLTHGPVMLCGPDPMMTAMRALFVELGVPDAEIHQEAFVSPPTPSEADPAADGAAMLEAMTGDGAPANVTFKRVGKSAEITPELSLLECAEDAGVEIPFECRSGICGQCKTKLLSGRVRMEVQDALTAADKSRGLVLACQAHAVGDIVVDA